MKLYRKKLCVSETKHFFLNCLLPELVDIKHSRNMPLRNPDYVYLEVKMAKEQGLYNK